MNTIVSHLIENDDDPMTGDISDIYPEHIDDLFPTIGRVKASVAVDAVNDGLALDSTQTTRKPTRFFCVNEPPILGIGVVIRFENETQAVTPIFATKSTADEFVKYLWRLYEINQGT
jgi:hypothetical protein